MSNQTVSTTILPQEVSDATKEILGASKTLSETKYPVFSGPRIAGLNADQTKAFDMTREAAGKWTPLTDFASKTWGDPGTVDAYMSPYLKSVLGDTMSELQRSGDIQRKQIGRTAMASNAFGDDRHAILESEFNRSLADVAGRTANSILAQGYESAAQKFGADRDAQMKLAQLIPSLAFQDAGALWGIGSQEQAQQQRNLDLAYEDFLRQVLWPQEQLNWRTGILSQVPYNITQATTLPKGMTGGGNDLASLLGGGAALFGGLGSLLFGSGGGGLSELLGWG